MASNDAASSDGDTGTEFSAPAFIAALHLRPDNMDSVRCAACYIATRDSFPAPLRANADMFARDIADMVLARREPIPSEKSNYAAVIAPLTNPSALAIATMLAHALALMRLSQINNVIESTINCAETGYTHAMPGDDEGRERYCALVGAFFGGCFAKAVSKHRLMESMFECIALTQAIMQHHGCLDYYVRAFSRFMRSIDLQGERDDAEDEARDSTI
ncbi:MAG: hypothetical protein M0R66_08515 [Candidatus Omnitrophica bacterium]|nr:hypothetical protein [Candidatus Omnitrophota bacterium]